MNKNIFTRLLAVASLAMYAAAKDQKVIEVNEKMLSDMNWNDEEFVMSRDETLTLLMDADSNWGLQTVSHAPYTVLSRY